MFECVYVYVSVQVPAERRGIESRGARVLNGCEPPHMGAGNTT